MSEFPEEIEDQIGWRRLSYEESLKIHRALGVPFFPSLVLGKVSSTTSRANRLREAAKQFFCTTSSQSKPKGWLGARDCPCPRCKAQAVVLSIADELEREEPKDD